MCLKARYLVKSTWSAIPALQALELLEPHFIFLLKKSLTIFHCLKNNVPTAQHCPPLWLS